LNFGPRACGSDSLSAFPTHYEMLQPRVAQVLVCDPRKNDRRGSKNDHIDARELADLLRCGRMSFPANI